MFTLIMRKMHLQNIAVVYSISKTSIFKTNFFFGGNYEPGNECLSAHFLLAFFLKVCHNHGIAS